MYCVYESISSTFGIHGKLSTWRQRIEGVSENCMYYGWCRCSKSNGSRMKYPSNRKWLRWSQWAVWLPFTMKYDLQPTLVKDLSSYFYSFCHVRKYSEKNIKINLFEVTRTLSVPLLLRITANTGIIIGIWHCLLKFPQNHYGELNHLRFCAKSIWTLIISLVIRMVFSFSGRFWATNFVDGPSSTSNGGHQIMLAEEGLPLVLWNHNQFKL